MPEYTCLSHISVASGPVEVSLRRMACNTKSRTYTYTGIFKFRNDLANSTSISNLFLKTCSIYTESFNHRVAIL